MAAMLEKDIKSILRRQIAGIDEDTLEYFQSMVDATDSVTAVSLKEALAPFIESYGLAPDLAEAEKICDKILEELGGIASKTEDYEPVLLQKTVLLADVNKAHLKAEEIESMWGFESVRKNKNTVMEFSEAASARYERKAAKEQRKWLEELESTFVGEEDNNQVRFPLR